MGRPNQKLITYAYIAGFLDGDGSIMVQIKKRSDTSSGIRLMFTIVLYQDIHHEKPLLWMQKALCAGYISRRNDGITELRVNGYSTVQRILKLLQPFVKFKYKQVHYTLQLLELIDRRYLKDMSKSDRRKIAEFIIKIRNENYASAQRKYTDQMVHDILNF